MAMVARPLRLKDLLELDCESCSAAGFRCYPRHLCVAVPLPLPARHEVAAEPHGGLLGRSHSLRRPMLSIRSLSRRLRGSFSWSRRVDEEAAPVPAASISCSSADSETSVSSSTERKSESDFSSACSAESLGHAGVTATTKGQEHEAMKMRSKAAGTGSGSGSGSESDDKEQLSPVAVMDFPFHDDDDDAVEEEGISDGGRAFSPSFGDSLAQLRQRRNIQLKHKIRRFRSIGEVVAAVDLAERFAASESDGLSSVPAEHCRTDDTDVAKAPSRLEEGHRSVDVRQCPDEHNLIGLLTRIFPAVDGSQRLLLDFFAETRKQSCEAALKLAEDWMQGTGARWGLKEVLCGREDLVAEIHREQQWSSHAGEEIGVLVAGFVIDELVRELVNDLLL